MVQSLFLKSFHCNINWVDFPFSFYLLIMYILYSLAFLLAHCMIVSCYIGGY